ncbi:MAG: alkaline phosphatase family protein [Myxococcota bacterium]|nr:alkaline phosphatase family protein [Myxococcota bacterium]
MFRRSVAFALALGLSAPIVQAASPKLVVLIAVDQLRRDRLDATLPGGLGRIVREGHVFSDSVLDHATTETCAGHVTMLTGRHPGPSGIVGNTYIDLETGERRYCVEDHAADAAVLGGGPDPEDGRSPRNLRVDTLGDWMKAADPEVRVFSVAAKDRSAITLAGRQPDGAYWMIRDGAPIFTTSRYYREGLPEWVEAFNRADGGGLASRVPSHWTHATEPLAGRHERVDDFPGESDERSRVSPHPLHAASDEDFAGNLYASPFVDDLTLAFARALVEEEGLGTHGHPDLLAIALAATDTVGHAYGPGSLEARDALLRLDASLGELLAFLESRVGKDRLLVVLTADHGVLPLPEWLEATGGLECPLEGGRHGLIGFILRLEAELHFVLSPFSWPGFWVNASSQLTVNRELAADRGVPIERVVAVAEQWLEEQPVVREAWTRKEIAQGKGEFARLYRNSFDKQRSGDLAIQLEPTCLLDFQGAGTSHGSPYGYDRNVPIVFFGSGIAAGSTPGPAATVDIAPTLAARIGLVPPSGLDGRNLLPVR